MKKPDVLATKLLWMDLEMTGLDPDRDLILEVAVEVTDFKFKILESYEARVRSANRQAVAARMQSNSWWKDFPINRDDFLIKLDEARPLGVVEDELIQLVKKHFKTSPAVLAGNSIHNDRAFVKQWWPALDSMLHYRMLDVSAFKVLMQGKYGIVFEKQGTHRAFDDIQASIAELQYYLDYFKNDPQAS